MAYRVCAKRGGRSGRGGACARRPAARPADNVQRRAHRGYFIAQSPDGRLLYVPRLGKSELWVVDTVTNQARGRLTEARPYWQVDASRATERGLAVSPDGRRLHIATQDDLGGGVSVLHTTSFVDLARASMGSGFFGLALTSDGARLLLTSPENLT